MATSSTNSTDTAVLAGQTIQYSEPVMGPSLCASRHDRSERRNPPHNSLPLREYVSVFLTKITAVARFWYPQDEQVGDYDSRGEEVEGRQQTMAVCNQPREQGPQCAADGLRAKQHPDARAAHVLRRRFEQPGLDDRPRRVKEKAEQRHERDEQRRAAAERHERKHRCAGEHAAQQDALAPHAVRQMPG